MSEDRCTNKSGCTCLGQQAIMRAFCEHYNAEHPETEVNRESIRMWSSLSEDMRERCLRHMRKRIPDEVRSKWYVQRRRGTAIGSDALRFHFEVGMNVRNLLREVVPDDELPWVSRVGVHPGEPPIVREPTQWDDYYYGALCDFVGADAAHPVPKGYPWRDRCKRFRTDGPTPCLCCPDVCVGDWPGHTYKEACNYRDGALDGGRLDSTTPDWPLWKFVVWIVSAGLIRIK